MVTVNYSCNINFLIFNVCQYAALQMYYHIHENSGGYQFWQFGSELDSGPNSAVAKPGSEPNLASKDSQVLIIGQACFAIQASIAKLPNLFSRQYFH